MKFALLHFQFVKDGLDLLKLRPLVRVSIPTDLDDSTQVMVYETWNKWTRILLSDLHVCKRIVACVTRCK